jgi:uncharacterized protein (TIGR02757 family)
MPRRPPIPDALLKQRLDTLAATFDITTIAPDPLQLVLRFAGPKDQEVAGLIAAAFAYGRANMIVANIGVVLTRMNPSPYRYLVTFQRAAATKRFAGFAHRFHKTRELVELFDCLASAIQTHGSLGALFRKCHDERDADVGPALARFTEALIGARRSPALRYLLTSPLDGSACKRMNLYLRWMIRRTPPDLGLWTFVDPAKLVMPLDTHIHRITSFLGLNQRKTADWKTARALTDRLASFDASDPVRYDFALCRLGILDHCGIRKRKENCDVCVLNDVCRVRLR